MPILQIVRYGNPILTKKAEEIKNLDKYLELDESKLVEMLNNCGGFPKDITNKIKTANLYIPTISLEMNIFDTNTKFLKDFQKSEKKLWQVKDYIKKEKRDWDNEKLSQNLC